MKPKSIYSETIDSTTLFPYKVKFLVPTTAIYLEYLLKSAEYTIFYTFGMIFLGWSIWERREISGGR